MLCERCDKKEATFHLTEIRDEIKSEFHLCEICARQFRENSEKDNSLFPVRDMLNLLDIDEDNNGHLCAVCGLTESEYAEKGRLGCPSCYSYLRSFKKINGKYYGDMKYNGKKPLNYLKITPVRNTLPDTGALSTVKDEDISKLKVELENAVEEERYEDAARLRDIIREVGVE